ncbi:MAG: hypothetical protein CVU89_08500 [Firmicutes bacterium HGW-Firmicutes-14]|nr:MAG: hypothetical protein CVU89_08500 [Firmicutes bacterium HGW-Firmicutes-14]
MKTYNIALLGGDGIGPEVVDATKAVLEAVIEKQGTFKMEFNEFTVGHTAYKEFGEPLPEEAIEGVRKADATLLGAMSTGLVPPPSPMGVIRKTFDVYADVRPIQSFPGVWSLKEDMDIIVVRENTEGFLADRNLYQGYGEFMPKPGLVMSFRVISEDKSERIARYAFELARRQKRKKVTVAHKANVLRMGCGLFLDTVKKVAEEYPEIQLTDEYVDGVANKLIANPEDYDILLTTNMYGDVVSDEAAALVSSMVPTANIGADCAIFRPIHEAKLQIKEPGIVNPVPTILCGVMMLEHLGELEAAKVMRDGIKKVLGEQKIVVRENGGNNSTGEMVEAICNKIRG